MRKFFLGAALSATIIAGNMAPVLANSTNVNTDGEVTAHSVEVNPDLVEIEGRTLTDAEAANVEGEAWWVAAIPAAGAVGGFGYNTWRNVKNGRPWNDQWGTATLAGGATGFCGTAIVATRGSAFGASPYFGSSCSAAASYLYKRW